MVDTHDLPLQAKGAELTLYWCAHGTVYLKQLKHTSSRHACTLATLANQIRPGRSPVEDINSPVLSVVLMDT